MASEAALDSTLIIDTDSHVSEPADLWTSRVPKKWVEQVPYVVRNEVLGVDDWMVGDKRLMSLGNFAMAGYDGYIPDSPPSLSDADPAAFDPKARLDRLDEYGVYAQVLFPNVLAFFAWAFQGMQDQEIAIACVRAYNDFLTEFASADPARLLPLCVVPYWNLEESLKELERAHEQGHRGLVFGWQFEKVGLPPLRDPHWDPLLKSAQEMGMSINLHVAANSTSEQDSSKMLKAKNEFDRAEYAKTTSLSLVSNITAIAELTMTGFVAKYPDLKWISVESGFGYIPYLLETFDWQWENSGAFKDFPGMDKPSELFRQHIYASFWFEKDAVSLLPRYADNVLFETDFPHPTSLSPGPATSASTARVTVRQNLKDLSDETLEKILWSNAAKLFKVEKPAGWSA
jgi:predicted TIM-barrel fold metal-dependent hydrolase